MCEHSEFIAVVSVEAILSPEPDESLIVLYDLSNLGLGESLSSRKSREPDIVAIDYGDTYGARAAATQNDGATAIRSNADAEINLQSRSVGRRVFRWQSCTFNSPGQAIPDDLFQP